MRFIGAFILWIIIFIVAGGVYIWSGAYNIGADSHHWPITVRIIDVLRDHSIAQRDRNETVPNLDDAALIKEGAGHYAEMCVECHLAPGIDSSELRRGLYPQPPDLAKIGIDDPAEAFWYIKHGIKMSGMPAWGLTHDDQKLWSLVAFARKLPGMTPAQFKQLAAGAGEEEGHEMMQGMTMPSPAASSSSAAMPAKAGSQ